MLERREKILLVSVCLLVFGAGSALIVARLNARPSVVLVSTTADPSHARQDFTFLVAASSRLSHLLSSSMGLGFLSVMFVGFARLPLPVDRLKLDCWNEPATSTSPTLQISTCICVNHQSPQHASREEGLAEKPAITVLPSVRTLWESLCAPAPERGGGSFLRRALVQLSNGPP